MSARLLLADRSAETEPLEERSIGPTSLPSWDPLAPVERCGWCNLPIRRHRPEALALCDAALRAAIERRRAGLGSGPKPSESVPRPRGVGGFAGPYLVWRQAWACP